MTESNGPVFIPAIPGHTIFRRQDNADHALLEVDGHLVYIVGKYHIEYKIDDEQWSGGYVSRTAAFFDALHHITKISREELDAYRGGN